MAITPIQSTDNNKIHKPYIEAQGPVKTTNNIKPARPEGHLVDDSLGSKTKYFFKDIAYDMKFGAARYAGAEYTQEQYQAFGRYLEERTEGFDGDRQGLLDILLDIYATPVVNKLSVTEA